MIDPKTLTIGSHILVNGKRVEIECIINDSQIGYYLPNYDDWEACSPDEDWIEPIPITEELLTELGFEKREIPTFPEPTTMYVDAEYAKLRAEGNRLVVPRITLQYINVTNPFWSVSAFGKNMEDNKAAVRYLHELEAFLYLTTKTELIKE